MKLRNKDDGDSISEASAEGPVRTIRLSSASLAAAEFNKSVKSFGERLADRIRAFARPWELASFIWVPAIVLGFSFWYEIRSDLPLQDYGIFRGAASAVLHGRSPFVAPTAHALAGFDKFVYPPATALFFSPLTVLPLEVARMLMLVACVACVLGGLRLLDVSDWRCYGVAVMSAPVVNSLALGALTSFLFVGAAAAWRYRDRPAAVGWAAGLTAALKIFLWPLGIWLLVTRRVRSTVVFAVAVTVVLLAGWAVIGFAGLRSYPRLLHVLTTLEAHTSYSPVALLQLSGAAATALSVALVATVVVAVALASRGANGDRRAFAVAVLGALVATPVLWMHYFVLLYVPMALYRPRLSAVWFVPLVLWLTPTTHSHGTTWRIALALAAMTAVAIGTVGERLGRTDRARRYATLIVPRRIHASGAAGE
jgi:alpha-1,2-mannosyltransferase